ncbi:hypothetical protein R1sor_009735 [Riccia sorocarpa]|uniref:Uncharacterized protein n=1 Tax=Riccia sorocarpa TaxID=122646 RepID=A0ABD3I225_9MARC
MMSFDQVLPLVHSETQTQDKLSLGNHQKEEMKPLERDSMSQELGDKSKGIKFTENGSFMDASNVKDSRGTKFSKAPSGGIIEKHVTEEKQDSFTQKVYESEPDEESAPTREAGEGDLAIKGSGALRDLFVIRSLYLGVRSLKRACFPPLMLIAYVT